MIPLSYESQGRDGPIIMHPEKGEGVFIMAASLAVVNVLVLILRLWSRRLSSERRLCSDDLVTLAAFVGAHQILSVVPCLL